MNAFAITLLLISVALMLLLPRRLAPLSLLIGACCISYDQVAQLGPFHFSIIRIIIATGLVRIIIRGERLLGRMNDLDWLMLVWSVWMLISGLFHKDPLAGLVNRLGLTYDACGIYLLFRVFCQSLDDVLGLCRNTAVLLVPVVAAMLYEKLTASNFYSILGEGSASTIIRGDQIRARGPFAHAILAGCVGAVCLPLIVPLWRSHRKIAVIGIGACLMIIFSSGSSGPYLSAIAAIAALFMWRYRNLVRVVLWLMIIGYIGLNLVMTDPAYFIIAHIDLTGSSTGWHRARLIQSAIEHLSEWWLVGTDYTRHWMPSGVYWSEEHTDITSHYLQMGVLGGLPLMLLFIAILAKGFSFVGKALRQVANLPSASQFMIWALGASLIAHAAAFISVSYFDQSLVFFYLTLAAIGSVWSGTLFQSGAMSRAD